MNLEHLCQDLALAEGYRRKPYQDSVGIWTVGYGRNLESVGIRKPEARYLLENDIEEACEDLDGACPWWRELSDARMRALCEMCFNLGLTRLSGFKKMLAALEAGKYEKAAAEALDSKWAKQVGDRAKRIAKQIEEG